MSLCNSFLLWKVILTHNNDNCFVYDEIENCKLNGRNMYHTNPSYLKMGLYRSGSQTNDREIYFDDFNMSTGRVHYFPLEEGEN